MRTNLLEVTKLQSKIYLQLFHCSRSYLSLLTPLTERMGNEQ